MPAGDDENLTPKKNNQKPQRYPVQPREMTTGEMHTLKELIDTFGNRLTLRIHEYKKQQVWEMHAESDALAKYVEQRLEKQRTQRNHLDYCIKQPLTDPQCKPDEKEPKPASIVYLDGVRQIELYLLRNPMKWDGQTGRMPDKNY